MRAPKALFSEKAMAPHSSILAWKIQWMEGPGGLQSMGSLRVGHNWATSLSLFTFTHWRRTWQPTPVFLPGESQGWGSLVGCRLWKQLSSSSSRHQNSFPDTYWVHGAMWNTVSTNLPADGEKTQKETGAWWARSGTEGPRREWSPFLRVRRTF